MSQKYFVVGKKRNKKKRRLTKVAAHGSPSNHRNRGQKTNTTAEVFTKRFEQTKDFSAVTKEWNQKKIALIATNDNIFDITIPESRGRHVNFGVVLNDPKALDELLYGEHIETKRVNYIQENQEMLKYLLKEVGDFWKAQFQTLQETYSKTYEFSDILLNEIYIRLHTRSKDGEIVNDVSLNDAGEAGLFYNAEECSFYTRDGASNIYILPQ